MLRGTAYGITKAMAPCLWSPCHKQRSARFTNCPYVKKKAPLVPICTKDAFAFLLLFHSCTLFQAFLSCAVHLLLRMDSNSAVHPYHQAGKLFSLLARGACYVSNRFPYAPLRIKERTSPKLSLADALVFYDLYSTQEKMICQIFFDPLAPPASKILCALSTQKRQIGLSSCQIFRTHENRRQKGRSLLPPDSLQKGFSGAELQNLRHPAR